MYPRDPLLLISVPSWRDSSSADAFGSFGHASSWLSSRLAPRSSHAVTRAALADDGPFELARIYLGLDS